MVDSLVGCQGDRGTSSDGDGGGRGTTSTTNVAAKIVRGKISHGRVVVGVLADVLVLGALGTVCRQVLEDVVTVGHFGERAQNCDGSEGLHDVGSRLERMTMCEGSRGCWITDAVLP